MSQLLISHLDDDVSFPGAGAVQFTVFLHHNDLSFLLHLLHVLLYLVEDAAVVLLGYTNKLGQNRETHISNCFNPKELEDIDLLNEPNKITEIYFLYCLW